MAEIFIGYKSEERDKARLIAAALESEGWSVWWDIELIAGDSFHQRIADEIDGAKCAIVLWSNLSVRSDFVVGEASRAKKRDKLVPVRLDDAEAPPAFEVLHTIDLQGWKGTPNAPAFRELVRHVTAKAGSPPARFATVTDLHEPSERASVSRYDDPRVVALARNRALSLEDKAQQCRAIFQDIIIKKDLGELIRQRVRACNDVLIDSPLQGKAKIDLFMETYDDAKNRERETVQRAYEQFIDFITGRDTRPGLRESLESERTNLERREEPEPPIDVPASFD